MWPYTRTGTSYNIEFAITLNRVRLYKANPGNIWPIDLIQNAKKNADHSLKLRMMSTALKLKKAVL